MKVFAIISILAVSFACTVSAADVGVMAIGPLQVATLQWARDEGYRVGDWHGRTVYCKSVNSLRTSLPHNTRRTLTELEAAYENVT